MPPLIIKPSSFTHYRNRGRYAGVYEGVVNKTLFEPVSTPHNLLPLCRATCHLSQSIRRDVTNYQTQLKKRFPVIDCSPIRVC